MRLRAAVVASMMLMRPVASSNSPERLFDFLKPTIQFSDDDRSKLDERGIVLKILPASGHELAVLAAGSINVTPDALVSAVRNIAELKRSALVPQISRFSPQPRLDDVRELTLDAVDLGEIKRCHPERCGLKLTPEEISRLRHAAATDGVDSNESLQREFRRLVLERAETYLHSGDDKTHQEVAMLIERSPYIRSRMPHLVEYLDRYPAVRLAGAESFLYWSKEVYAWKPMISVTHVTILRGSGDHGSPEVLVASRDVFATRYTSGSFTVTMLFRDPESGAKRYLVYINRTWVDGVRALWRPFVEHRIKGQAKKVFAGVRQRIETQAMAAASRR